MVTAEAKWNAYLADRNPGPREQLILQYAPLVKYVVGRLAIGLPNTMDFEDAVSYGTLGLIEALERYDPTRGVKFETYAIARIRGAIMDALRTLDRLPRSVRQKERQIEKVTAELEAALGRPPAEEEVAQRMEVSLDRYRGMLVDIGWSTVSLEGLLHKHDYGESVPPVQLADAAAHEEVIGGIERKELTTALAEAVGKLPERERLIIALYYQDEMKMKEISRILEVSESRVCQLHGKAVNWLRMALHHQFE